MKHLLLLLPTILLLAACRGSEDTPDDIVPPEPDPITLNTGKLLSIDGSRLHIAYTYDAEGRVTYAEQFDSTWYVVKKLAEYSYDADRIYIVMQEFAEMPNGEHDPGYSRDFIRDDTLFLVNGRVDSMAGAMRTSLNSFFYKFRYDELGQLTHVHNDNIQRDRKGKLAAKPWYTEKCIFEWQDGNVFRRTSIIATARDTTVCTFRYSPLMGTFVGSEPRSVLTDLDPLFATGYFGTPCRNLPEGLDSDSYMENSNYLLGEDGLLRQQKSNVTFTDGLIHNFTYNIRWDTAP